MGTLINIKSSRARIQVATASENITNKELVYIYGGVIYRLNMAKMNITPNLKLSDVAIGQALSAISIGSQGTILLIQ